MTDLSLGRLANDQTAPQDYAAADIDPHAVIGAEIIIEQLHKFYGSVKVLEDLDLHIQPGEFLAIVGRSGCGKRPIWKNRATAKSSSSQHVIFVKVLLRTIFG